MDELPPVTLEEYEAVQDNVSRVETKLMVVRVSLQLQLADHSINGLPRQRKIVESRVCKECASIHIQYFFYIPRLLTYYSYLLFLYYFVRRRL